ncbi:MAG: hypothetical protein AVDCRST_MAG95-3617 [uncultured Adhaeribacter sp.]|uniref:Uncharacterized protein n=1 Tax=uncultured Adhaeribacter sp. TaxID=448109 RepID=A0A6J4JRF7_9BACT|nr:MAG: hypothetical protein AVDCRST_MAG95-3617 [uncultured Adhaeribacter sp.]
MPVKIGSIFISSVFAAEAVAGRLTKKAELRAKSAGDILLSTLRALSGDKDDSFRFLVPEMESAISGAGRH